MRLLIIYFILLFTFCLGYQYFNKDYKFNKGQCVYTNLTGTKIYKRIDYVGWANYYYSLYENGEYIQGFKMKQEPFEGLHILDICPKES